MSIRFRKIFAPLALFALSVTTVSAAEPQRYVPLPPALDGSMMPFDFKSCTQIPYLPDSLTPVYATYVARHGSRYLSSPKKIESLMTKLEKARNKGKLSDHGDSFFSLLETIRSANEDNWGALSPLGVMEEKKLAKRIYSTIPCLEKQPMQVNAISSYVPRSVMTMYQFTGELVRLNDHLTVITDEGRKFSPLVRCFTADKQYQEFRENGDWRPIYDDFVDRNVSAEPAKRLFSNTNLSDHELKILTMEMYEILKGNRAAGLPAPTTRWMSVTEYKECWRASNLMHYLRNSITPVSDAAARATTPLLEDMIAKTDSALSTGALQLNGLPQPTINAWFGHAETLLPLLSLIRLPGCFDMPLDYDKLDECWRIQNITPLAANLLLLVARGPSGRDYACVQLNGRTVQPVCGMPDVLPWDQLRAYWKHQIQVYNPKN